MSDYPATDTYAAIRADLHDLAALVGIGDEQARFLLERVAAVMRRESGGESR